MRARSTPLSRLGAGVAVALALNGCGDAPQPRADTAETPPRSPEDAPPFLAVFEDATASSGIEFRHVTGGFGEKRLPETMGSGACLFDHDGDDRLDLFLVGGTRWPDGPDHVSSGRCALYRGNGDGTFEDVSRETGADLELYGMGVIAADHDGDGDRDLFVTAVGQDRLLENDGGTFRDVAVEAGLTGHSGAEDWTTAAVWFDADADGDLDLFVGGYVTWSPETEIFTTFDGVAKVFTTPERYPGLPSRLYLNDGAGTYHEAEFEGERPTSGKVLAALAHDLDGDGLPEVLAANDTRPNFLFANRGDGRFEETGLTSGLAYDETGRARAGMGIDSTWLGGERLVVAIGNFAGEPLSLYERTERGQFRPAATRAGLDGPTFRPLAFGLAFADLDLDGWLDLVVVNGHIEPDIARYQPESTHAQSALVLRGLPDGRFEDVSSRAGADFTTPRVGRGLAVGDVDDDGDVDLIVTQNGGPAVLLLNRLQERTPRRYLRVRLDGGAANRDGLGAVIELSAGGRIQRRVVRTGGSYLSQGETTATFGLGTLATVEQLTVHWPDGARSSLDGNDVGEVDRTLVVTKPR